MAKKSAGKTSKASKATAKAKSTNNKKGQKSNTKNGEKQYKIYDSTLNYSADPKKGYVVVNGEAIGANKETGYIGNSKRQVLQIKKDSKGKIYVKEIGRLLKSMYGKLKKVGNNFYDSSGQLVGKTSDYSGKAAEKSKSTDLSMSGHEKQVKEYIKKHGKKPDHTMFSNLENYEVFSHEDIEKIIGPTNKKLYQIADIDIPIKGNDDKGPSVVKIEVDGMPWIEHKPATKIEKVWKNLKDLLYVIKNPFDMLTKPAYIKKMNAKAIEFVKNNPGAKMFHQLNGTAQNSAGSYSRYKALTEMGIPVYAHEVRATESFLSKNIPKIINDIRWVQNQTGRQYEPATVEGHSFGGMVMKWINYLRPNLIKGTPSLNQSPSKMDSKKVSYIVKILDQGLGMINPEVNSSNFDTKSGLNETNFVSIYSSYDQLVPVDTANKAPIYTFNGKMFNNNYDSKQTGHMGGMMNTKVKVVGKDHVKVDPVTALHLRKNGFMQDYHVDARDRANPRKLAQIVETLDSTFTVPGNTLNFQKKKTIYHGKRNHNVTDYYYSKAA